MLINAGSLISVIKSARIVEITGSLGAGKTSLAFRLGYELLNSGFCRILTSNVPNVWNTYPDEWVIRDKTKIDCCIILDEGGQFIKSRSDSEQFIAGLRKINSVVISPSKSSLNRDFAEIKIELVQRHDVIGLPVWVYSWNTRGGKKKDEQKFYWVRPSEIFGVYSTQDWTASANGIDISLGNLMDSIEVEDVRVWYPNNKKAASKASKINAGDNNIPKGNTSQERVQELENEIWWIKNQLEEQAIRFEELSLHKSRSRC